MASSMMVLARAPLEEDTARGREGGVGDQLDRRAVHSYRVRMRASPPIKAQLGLDPVGK